MPSKELKDSLKEVRKNNPYKIFSSFSFTNLSKQVNVAIKNGYEPLGGVFYSDNLSCFFQAMIYKK